MEQEDKEMLRKTLELSQKNYNMISSIKRSIFWTKVFSVIYWIFIVVVAVGAYYYLQPYIDKLLSVYSSFKGIPGM